MELKRKSKVLWLCISLLIVTIVAIIIVMVLPVHAFAASAETQYDTAEIGARLYEFADDNGSNSYNFSSTRQVSNFSNGSSSLGVLTVKGESITKTTYNGVDAIGVNAGTAITFTYKQTVSNVNYGGHDWKLSSDAATTIGGQSVGTIGNGGIVVLQSYDGKTWKASGAKMVGINGQSFVFTPQGSDVKNGSYYRFLSGAEMYYTYVSGQHTEWVFWPFKKKTVTDYANYYTNLGQESTVYVCANNPSGVSFKSQAISDFKIEKDDLTQEEIALIKKGTTLSDGGVSFSYIEIDNAGNNCYKISLQYNNGPMENVGANKKLSSPGKYEIKVRTPLGKERTTTLYIVNPGEDRAYSSYFGNGIIDDQQRIYDTTKAVPVYMIGKKFAITPQSEYLPGIYGKIYYYKDDSALKANAYEIMHEFSGLTMDYSSAFNKQGYYIFDLYSSNPEVLSGEIIRYSFRLYIKDFKEYAPTVNKDLLTSTSRNNLFVRKVYAVTLKTAGGGSFIYCFPHTNEYYDLAYSIAENIELLSVETYPNYYYYKSRGSNTKVQYTSKSKLFNAISDFATENISTLYLESNTEYLTYAADEKSLKDLTKQSITKDTCVVTDVNVKRALQAEEIYVNDFVFQQIANYESDVVMAIDENGQQFHVHYNVSLNSIMSTTQRMQFTEENWNGRITYEGIYYAPGDNKGTLNLSISGNNEVISLESARGLSGSDVSIESGGDPYDSQSLLVITNEREERTVMLLSEAVGYAFPDTDMTYKISIVNRFGTEYSFALSTVKAPEQSIESNKFGSNETNGTQKIDVGINGIYNNQSSQSNTTQPIESNNSDESAWNPSNSVGVVIDKQVSNSSEKLPTGAIIAISVGGFAIVGLIVFVLIAFLRKRRA